MILSPCSTAVEHGDPVALCIEEPVGTFTSWLRRASWEDGVETREWSSDGVTWQTATPTGIVRAGACSAAGASYTTPVLVCIENPANIFVQWFERSRFSNGVETREWSTDGVTWVTATPAGTRRPGLCDMSGGTPGGLSSTGTTVRSIPASTRSFTVSLNSAVGGFDISFDSGATWPLTGLVGSRTWGQNNRPLLLAANVRVRGTTAASVIDLIWQS